MPVWPLLLKWFKLKQQARNTNLLKMMSAAAATAAAVEEDKACIYSHSNLTIRLVAVQRELGLPEIESVYNLSAYWTTETIPLMTKKT